MTPATAKPPKPRPVGEVLSTALYTKEELCRRMKWAQGAWGAALRKGLRARKLGRNYYVNGAEVLRFVESLPAVGEGPADA
jgi:hypothetical protein